MDEQINEVQRGLYYFEIESFADWLDGYRKKSDYFPSIDGHEIMRSIAVSRIVEMRSYLDDITKALMRGHIRNDEVQHALSLADDMEDLAKIIYDTIEVYSDYDKHVKAEVKAFHDERKKAADANHN